jgi:drug/metabolite transporter (DMT)-like permease
MTSSGARADARGNAASGRRWAVGAALVTTWITTGGNFLAFKAALIQIQPLALMFARLAAAGILLLATGIAIAARTRPSRRQIALASVAGVLSLGLGQGGIVWGVRSLPSGKTAVFAASAPVFVALFSWLVLRARLRWQTCVGIAVGCAGLALMSVGGNDGSVTLGPVLWVLGGSAFWAAGALFAHRACLPDCVFVSGGVQMLAAATSFLIPAACQGGLSTLDPRAWSSSTLAAFGYLCLVGLGLGYTAYAWLNQSVTPALANTFQYVSPFLALAAGALLLSEAVGPADIVAAALTLAGVALMVSATPESRPSVASLPSRFP